MTKHSDIFTPDGYLENLQDRLMSIPAREKQPSLMTRVTPYLAYAASLVLLVVLGNFILGKTAVSADDTSTADDWTYVSYLAQSLDADCMLPEIPEYTLTEDDIVNYLVDDGLTLEELVSYEENH